MCESLFYLCVPLTRSAPGFCRQLCFAGHQTICSADLIFNSFYVFIVVGNQWVKREIGEFERKISEIWAPWPWEPCSFSPSASASKPILVALNSNQKAGKPWTAKNSSQKLKRVRKRIFSGTPRSVTPSLWRQTVQEKYTLAPVWGL